jgi:addiction module HigA family antidote
MKNTKMIPAMVLHPGVILRDELEARGWTNKKLAQKMGGRPEGAISEILNGKKSITAETALQLAEALGTSAELWSRLQADYELHLARQRKPPSTSEPLIPVRLHRDAEPIGFCWAERNVSVWRTAP